jgi:hypothetical protein
LHAAVCKNRFKQQIIISDLDLAVLAVLLTISAVFLHTTALQLDSSGRAHVQPLIWTSPLNTPRLPTVQAYSLTLAGPKFDSINMADLDLAIEHSVCLHTAPLGYPNLAGLHNNLAVFLKIQFEHQGALADVDKAKERRNQSACIAFPLVTTWSPQPFSITQHHPL